MQAYYTRFKPCEAANDNPLPESIAAVRYTQRQAQTQFNDWLDNLFSRVIRETD